MTSTTKEKFNSKMNVHGYTVEKLLEQLNKRKDWKLGYVLLSISVMFPASWNFNVIKFITYTPDHHCKIPAHTNISDTIPFRNGKPLQCKQYENFVKGGKIVDCVNGWTYADKEYVTIVTEFDLVCDKSSSVMLLTVVFMFGRGIGSNLFPFMADNFGRKKILLLSQFLLATVSFSTIFCTSIPIFCVIRFITGACQQGVMLVGIVLTLEHLSSPNRTSIGITISFFWSFGNFILCFIAYFIKDWIFLQCTISLFPLLLMPIYQVIPESYVWLVANERIDKVQKRLLRYCKKERRIESKFVLTDLINVDENDFRSKPNYRMPMVCKSKALSKIFTTVVFLWWQLYLIYVALEVAMQPHFESNSKRFLLNCLAEITGYSLSFLTMKRFGRRHSVVLLQWFTTLSMFCYFLFHGVKHAYIRTAFTFLCRTGVNGTLAVGYIYTMELFPTNLRLQAMGFIIKLSGLSSFFAPVFATFANENPWAVFTVCGTLMLICSAAIYDLPETTNKALPHTFNTIIAWMPKKQIKNKGFTNVKFAFGEK